jgi:hypothetical protein
MILMMPVYMLLTIETDYSGFSVDVSYSNNCVEAGYFERRVYWLASDAWVIQLQFPSLWILWMTLLRY